MRAVNLLPPERRGGTPSLRLKSFKSQRVLLATAGIVLAALLGAGLWAHSASSAVSSKEQRLAALQRQLAAVRPANSSAASDARASASTRLNDVLGLTSRRMAWDGFLGGFARVVPEDVWLLSLTANPAGTSTAGATSSASSSSGSSGSAPATAPSTGTSAFTISGYTYTQASVARLLDRLALIPWLTDVQLQNSTLTQVGNRVVYQFTIGASMVNPGERVTS
jgi:Tfp pilus assembly protein PilN